MIYIFIHVGMYLYTCYYDYCLCWFFFNEKKERIKLKRRTIIHVRREWISIVVLLFLFAHAIIMRYICINVYGIIIYFVNLVLAHYHAYLFLSTEWGGVWLFMLEYIYRLLDPFEQHMCVRVVLSFLSWLSSIYLHVWIYKDTTMVIYAICTFQSTGIWWFIEFAWPTAAIQSVVYDYLESSTITYYTQCRLHIQQQYDNNSMNGEAQCLN